MFEIELYGVEAKNGEPIVSSTKVAKYFDKEHFHVVRDIENLQCSPEFRSSNFIKSTRMVRGKIYTQFLITKDGLKLYIDSKRKDNKNIDKIIEIYNYMNKEQKTEIINCKSRFETSFINKLIEFLQELEIGVVPQYSVLNYRLDCYIPKYNIAIEYDEENHRYTKDSDSGRMSIITENIGCSFIRLDYKNSDIKNIAIVIKEINKIIKERNL